MKIVIIDYGIGNIQSIFNALNQCSSIDIEITSDNERILNADGIILPGVGAFKKAMAELEKRNLVKTIQKFTQMKKPLLGICLGMQLLFESSEEFGKTEGLKILQGNVIKFPSTLTEKLPHISWNEINPSNVDWETSRLFSNLPHKNCFYFVHSYICKPENNEIILSTTEYGEINFCSAVKKDNIYGCQFHPEKSAQFGLAIMKNFIELVKKNS